MPVPVFYISANGQDVTANFAGVNMTMTITDGEGLKADTLQLQLDDVDGSIIAPKTGAILNPVGGYTGRLRDFGLFIVDSVAFAGWPQTISINAKSVAAKSLAKQREPKAYRKEEFPTYGDVFSEVAGKVGLTLEMASELKSLPNPFEAQAEEDGLEFLTRLGTKINAAVTVKSQRLVVVVKGKGKSAGGGALDVLPVSPGVNLISYSVTEADEPQHGEVEATYYDRDKNERKVVTEATGLEGPKMLLRSPYSEEGEAKRAAKAKAEELKRIKATASFQIDGEPFAQAEAYAEVSGCRPRVDGRWRIKTATHNFSATGPYTTSLECETPTE